MINNCTQYQVLTSRHAYTECAPIYTQYATYTDFFLVIITKTIQKNNYLHTVYILFGIINNPMIIENEWEGIHRFCVNKTSFYVRNLIIWILAI